ncbi:MAG: helix-turn-helix domain-containing protein [Planctomycetia bacterium]|nr:helix-turn-helix domain-containing protein [Planctomycetia bacterium]
METKNLITASEASSLLRLTTREVKHLALRGEIPAVRLPGDEFRFIESDLWAWIESLKETVGAIQ